MPVFGYMLLLNDNVHQYLVIRFDGRLLEYLPTTWRVWLLFYGSFFVAIGALAYAWFCPEMIKSYPNALDAADREAQHQISMGQYDTFLAFLRGTRPLLKGWHKDLLEDVPIASDEPHYRSLTMLQQVSNLLMYQWTVENVSLPAVRVSILLCFWTGFAFLAFPAAFTFVQVTFLLVKQLFS